MYKKRINDWQLHKNRKASEKEEISRIIEANQKLGVDLGEPMVNGRMVKMHLIERHRRENRKARLPSPTAALSGGRSTKCAQRSGPMASISISFSRLGDPTDFRTFENLLFQVDQYYGSKLGNDPHRAWDSWNDSSKPRRIDVSITFHGDTYTRIFFGSRCVFYRFLLADRYLRENRTRDAWRLIEEGAEMVRPLLQQESPHFLRELLLHFLDEYSGDYVGIQKQLLHLLTSMSFITYGRKHPISSTCQLLQTSFGKQHIIEQTLRKLHDTFKHHLGEDHSASLCVQDRLCTALRSQKRYAEAERSLQDLIKTNERCHGRNACDTRYTLLGLAELYFLQKRYAEAWEISKDILQRGKGSGECYVVNIYVQKLLGEISMSYRDYGAAKAFFSLALWSSFLWFGPKDPYTRHIWTMYQGAKERLEKGLWAPETLTHRPQEVWDISEEPLRCFSRPRSSSMPSVSAPDWGCEAGFWYEAPI
jgi:tetratricopeptide (TPR) repeat protein